QVIGFEVDEDMADRKIIQVSQQHEATTGFLLAESAPEKIAKVPVLAEPFQFGQVVFRGWAQGHRNFERQMGSIKGGHDTVPRHESKTLTFAVRPLRS